jgi:glycerol-3-phosphate acyltransferase PlsY
MIEIGIKLIAAYFVGGIMGGDIMRRLRGGGDLRNEGSGNVGATNALRARGGSFALGVLAIDIGKGIFAALVIPLITWPSAWHLLGASSLTITELKTALPYGCGFTATLGHCFPFLLHFRGGKGVATAAGVFGALLPAALPWMIGIFVLTILLTGWVAVASMLAALAALLYVVIAGAGLNSTMGFFAAAMSLLIIFKHRSNIANLMSGKEHAFEKARVLGRLFDRWTDRWRGR